MIVDLAVYQDGRRRSDELGLADAYEAAREDDAFVWLGVFEPTDEEFDSIRKEFDLHELAVEDAINAHQRPKIEVYGDSLFVVLKTARYVDTQEVVEFGEINMFIGESFIISVRHGLAGVLADVRRNCEAKPELLRFGPGWVLHSILDRIVDDYQSALAGLENDIDEVERQVFSAEANPGERIYKLIGEVLELHKATAPLVAVLDRLSLGYFKLIPEEVATYFRDVHDHAVRTVEQVQGFKELLNSVLSANLTQVSVRQNEDMRKISAYAALLAVPTMIAGFYGMNFDVMPELNWSFGYPLVLGLTALIDIVLFRYFRRGGWL